jgi:hypothetical protein
MPAYVLEECIIVWCQMLKTWFLPATGSFHLFQKFKFFKKNVENITTLLFTVVDLYFNRNNLVAYSFLVMKDKSVVAKNKLFTCTWIFVVQTYCSLALTFVYPSCANSCGLVKPTSLFCHAQLHGLLLLGHSEPAPTTSAPWKMDGKWYGNNFPLGSSSLANHGDFAPLLFILLPTRNQVVSR